jgi:AraC-like DNA-binding protein
MSIFQFTIPPLPHYLFSGEDTYSEHHTHPNRKNIDLFDLIVVTKGDLFLTEENREWTVQAGQALILRPDRHHYSTKPCEEETHFYWLHFHTKGFWCEQFEENIQAYGNSQKNPFYQGELFYLNIPRFCTLSNPIEIYEKFRKLLLIDNQVTPASRWQEQLIFQEILQELHRVQKPKANASVIKIAEKAAIYLQQNYQKPLSYDHLGKALNFHPTYVSRCMKEIFGSTPLEYLTSYRIEQSKILLMNTDLPVGHIAEKIGFNSTSYFTRNFSRLVHMTPLTFRKQFR